jgi:hypothetical protein
MSLLATLKAKLLTPSAPSRCEACKQSVMPLESYFPNEYFCPCCARSFHAVYVDGDWRTDLRPPRKRRR